MRIVTDYKHAQQIIIELDARIAKLEAAAKKTISEFIDEDADHSAACMNWALCEHSQHQCGLCDLREALANSEGENEPHPDHCLCDDCVTPENMEERLEISRKFMEQANSEVAK